MEGLALEIRLDASLVGRDEPERVYSRTRLTLIRMSLCRTMLSSS